MRDSTHTKEAEDQGKTQEFVFSTEYDQDLKD